MEANSLTRARIKIETTYLILGVGRGQIVLGGRRRNGVRRVRMRQRLLELDRAQALEQKWVWIVGQLLEAKQLGNGGPQRADEILLADNVRLQRVCRVPPDSSQHAVGENGGGGSCICICSCCRGADGSRFAATRTRPVGKRN